MKIFLFILFPLLLSALSPFETPKEHGFDLSVFDTKKSEENIKAGNNPKIKCRYVCDKRVYKEQRMADAISFYKKESNPAK